MTIDFQPAPYVVIETGSEEKLDQLLDRYLHQLLLDLQLLVPYDVAAAWLGHDDRPSLRVVEPPGTVLPAIGTTRHLIFQATAEAARVADLQLDHRADELDLRCWLGVPLVLQGRRRGWIEILSSQPNFFSDADLRRAQVLVRHCTVALEQLEAAAHGRLEQNAQRHLLRGIQAALYASSMRDSFTALLAEVVNASRADAAALVLPTELAYTFGFIQSDIELPPPEPLLEPGRLTTVVARWPQLPLDMTPVLAAANSTASEPSLQPASGLLPLVFQDEPIGWIVLSYKAEQPLKQVDPPTLQQVTTLTTAFVVWLREQVQREQHAQRSVRMLLQHTYQQRSSAISDLAAGLAHELHSPVGAIIGEVERLRGISVLPEAADSAIAVIATQARQINEAVMCLTNFSQTAVTTRVPVPLNDVLQNALTVVSGTAKQRGAKLECILPEQSPTVLANPGQIHRVCLELLSNALDAVEGTEQAVVSVEITIDDRWALIRINDNGYGIPDDLQERIFAPGYTTKSVGSSRQGQGIGLPMALGIARQHGGTIIVQSQIWAGSCFTLKLPLL